MKVQILSKQQMSQLFEEGYTIIRDAVANDKIVTARRAINQSLGKGMSFREAFFGMALGYCSELNDRDEILGLYYGSKVESAVKEILGEDNVEPVDSGQIALRFSQTENNYNILAPHIDGIPSPYNGITKDNYNNFELLVGVFLNDITEDYSGNLVVWPRSHMLFCKYFQENGPESILNGIPNVELGPFEQIKVKQGDAIICNYLLAHSVSPNLSPNIRYAIYFRVNYKNKDSWKTNLIDPWWFWQPN